MKHAIIYIQSVCQYVGLIRKENAGAHIRKENADAHIRKENAGLQFIPFLKSFLILKNKLENYHIEFMSKYLQVQILIENKIVKTKCCMTHWIQQLYAYRRPPQKIRSPKKFKFRKSSKSEKVRIPKKFDSLDYNS